MSDDPFDFIGRMAKKANRAGVRLEPAAGGGYLVLRGSGQVTLADSAAVEAYLDEAIEAAEETLSFYLPRALVEQFKQRVAEEGGSLDAYVNGLIRADLVKRGVLPPEGSP